MVNKVEYINIIAVLTISLPTPPLSERRYCDARRHAVCARRVSLGGEGNVLYPVLSSYLLSRCFSLFVIVLCISVNRKTSSNLMLFTIECQNH